MEEILKYTQFINEKKSSGGKKVLFVSFRKSEVEPDDNGHYMTKLPKSGHQVKLRPLSYGESTDLERMEEEYS